MVCIVIYINTLRPEYTFMTPGKVMGEFEIVCPVGKMGGFRLVVFGWCNFVCKRERFNFSSFMKNRHVENSKVTSGALFMSL